MFYVYVMLDNLNYKYYDSFEVNGEYVDYMKMEKIKYDFGRAYNASSLNNICPSGWEVASTRDWIEFVKLAGLRPYDKNEWRYPDI